LYARTTVMAGTFSSILIFWLIFLIKYASKCLCFSVDLGHLPATKKLFDTLKFLWNSLIIFSLTKAYYQQFQCKENTWRIFIQLLSADLSARKGTHLEYSEAYNNCIHWAPSYTAVCDIQYRSLFPRKIFIQSSYTNNINI
jgi:hypothetical protein